MSRSTTSRSPKQRTFAVTFSIEGTDYRVSPLPCHPDIGSRAVRFAKQGGDGAVYDLCLRPFGWECQCLGFERYGYCKHARTVQKAGRLFGAGTPTPAPRDGRPEFIEVLSEEAEAAAIAQDRETADPDTWGQATRVCLGGDGTRVSDEQLAEAMEHAPPMPEPTEEELNDMARHFGQD
jgi:hypothetical protein